MIERVKAQCETDPRVVAALMYGSFTRGEGDQFSDVEFCIFLQDEALGAFDAPEWLARIAPLSAVVRNEATKNLASR